MRPSLYLLLALALAMLLPVSPVKAQTQTASWVGGVGGSWNNPANWLCSPPNPSGPCIPSSITLATDVSAGTINVDSNSSVYQFGGSGTTLVVNGATLTATETVAISSSLTGAPGAVSINGGSVNSLNLSGALTLNDGTVGTSGLPSALATVGSSQIFNSTYTGILAVASGTLEVSTLSTLNTTTTAIASTGDASMSLSSTSWNSTGPIQIGGIGTNGQLTIGSLAGLTLNTWGISVGGQNGTGALTVANGGSITAAAGSSPSVGIQIGFPSGSVSGQMSIQDGGAVSVGSVYLYADTAGGSAALEMDGSHALLNTGIGGMTLDGGTVTATNGATLDLGGALSLNAGQVSLQSSASLSAPSVTLGNYLPSLAGVGGASGTATLTVEGGASVSGVQLLIAGLNAGSNGTMTLTGDGTTWGNTGGAVIVGFTGTGTLNIADGATLTSINGNLLTGASGAGFIAEGPGGRGSVNISGDDSTWEADGDVQVGGAGTGALNLSDSAEMTAVNMSIGSAQSGSGTVSLTGGSLTLSGTLTVGDAGSGTLSAAPNAPDDEGDIVSQNAIIGAQVGSSGTVVLGSAVGQGLQPTSSDWNIKNSLIVGQAGSGTLDIGGSVEDLTATIAQLPTGNGQVLVENGGMWTTTNNVIVGDQGIGSLTIQTGGFANLTVGEAILGNQLGSSGTVNVQGQWNMTQNLVVGNVGAGNLTIDGGAVASGDGHIGYATPSTGTVLVTGTNSSWSVDGTLYVGQGGNGILQVENGGQVFSRDGSIGNQAVSVGSVTITGAQSLWSAMLPGGSGTISVGGNGSQGTLTVQNGGEVQATTITVGTQGSLNGQGGTFAAAVVNNGGFVTPGDAAGVMSVNGSYTQNSGTTEFEIDGSAKGLYDQLIVSGDVHLLGGSLDILFANGFAPTLGETFDLISAASLDDSGTVVDLSGLPAGYVFDDEFSSTGLDLVTEEIPGGGSGGSGGNGGAPGVPEPSTACLLAVGLASLLAVRKRQQARP
jgi:T5SS/PEP-CTERM-associated repeat protein